MSSRYTWESAVSDCSRSEMLIRGYRLSDIIGNLTYTETVFLTIRGQLPDKRQAQMLDAALCAIVDYSIGPAPFAARVVVSANPQMGAAMAAGILAQGDYAISPQHTGALLLETAELERERGLNVEQAAAEIVARLRARRQRVPGAGHPSHGRDVRAERLRAVGERLGFLRDHHARFAAILADWERVTGRQLVANVDGMLAVVLLELGFSPAEMAGIAALSTLPGIIANVSADLNAGVRIRQVPDQAYTGEPERPLPGPRRD